jgi:hypothetical protein
MSRREFITLLASVAVWPLTARAQQMDRMRRIGVLMALAADDPAGQARFVAFVQALQELGWTDGRNVRIDTRWAAGDAERFRRYAAELVALAPDVILASGGTGVGALLQVTRTVPIVFTQTQDPVGAGYVDSLALPGGNTTGFTNAEYGARAGNTWSCSKRSHRASRERQSFGIRLYPRGSVSSAPSKPWRRHSGWNCAYRRARRTRDRASRHGIRTIREWRPDRDRERVDGASSRSHHHAGGPPQIARGLLGALLRDKRRPHLLRGRFD